MPEQKAVNEGIVKIARELGVAAGGDQRLPLPAARGPLRPRRADLHPDRQDRPPTRDRMTYSPAALPEEPRGDGEAVRLGAGSGREHAGRGRVAASSRSRSSRCTYPSSRCPMATTSTATSRRWRGTAWRSASPSCGASRRRAICANRSRSTAKRLDREIKIIRQMGFGGLLPDHLGLHPLRARARHPGRPGPRDRPRARSSPTACASPTSTRCSTTCCSSGSSTPSACRCPISTSTSVSGKRERVIDYVTHKYGRENVAQIITFGTMAARAVIRDVGRGRRPGRC